MEKSRQESDLREKVTRRKVELARDFGVTVRIPNLLLANRLLDDAQLAVVRARLGSALVQLAEAGVELDGEPIVFSGRGSSAIVLTVGRNPRHVFKVQFGDRISRRLVSGEEVTIEELSASLSETGHLVARTSLVAGNPRVHEQERGVPLDQVLIYNKEKRPEYGNAILDSVLRAYVHHQGLLCNRGHIMTDPLLGNFMICPESGAVLAHDLLGIEPMIPLEEDLHARVIQYRNFVEYLYFSTFFNFIFDDEVERVLRDQLRESPHLKPISDLIEDSNVWPDLREALRLWGRVRSLPDVGAIDEALYHTLDVINAEAGRLDAIMNGLLALRGDERLSREPSACIGAAETDLIDELMREPDFDDVVMEGEGS